MSGDAPESLTIGWTDQAKSDLRAIDREAALEILHCVARYLETRNGDVKKLQPPLPGLRLRCGEYRIFFKFDGPQRILVGRVRHRRDAYR